MRRPGSGRYGISGPGDGDAGSDEGGHEADHRKRQETGNRCGGAGGHLQEGRNERQRREHSHTEHESDGGGGDEGDDADENVDPEAQCQIR